MQSATRSADETRDRRRGRGTDSRCLGGPSPACVVLFFYHESWSSWERITAGAIEAKKRLCVGFGRGLDRET